MKAYHMSQTLQVGDKLKAGYKRNEIRCREVISTLEQSEQCLETTIASMKLQGDEWREYVKWCVEGIFEFVRETEFSFLPSRLNCSYYFDNIEYYKVLYEAGWAQKSEEERAQIRLFEVDLEEEKPTKYDMLLFDEAFDVMLNTKNIKGVVECARKYFSGECSNNPVWEIMSDKPAIATKDITEILLDCLGRVQTMKTFSFIVWQIKIPFYEIPVLGHSPFSIYKSTIRCYAEIILRLKVSSDPEEYKNSIITMWSISQKRFRRLLRQSEILYKKG